MKKLFLTLCGLCYLLSATAQQIIQPNEWQFDGTGIPPGTTIYLPAGTRGPLLIKNLKGTATKPITIINQGGKAVITVPKTNSYALKTQSCKYFKILGNGVTGIKYGIEVSGGNISVSFDDLSSDFVVEYLDVHDSGFAGIMAKTDPTSDPKTQRGNFTLNNPVIKYNYVHNTGGEGVYLGNSFYNSGVNGFLPHDVVNAIVANNITDRTGCEGIQVGAGIKGTQIYGNKVTSPGQSPFASGQSNGIQVGEGTGGKCYNNFVKDAPGNGIIVLGLGNNLVYNNIIVNSGENGIFADSRYTPGPFFSFINNTIIGSKSNGIKLNSTSISMQYVVNNVIIGQSPAITAAMKIFDTNNFKSSDINSAGFIDPLKDNYRLKPKSPLINKGLNVVSYGVQADFYGKSTRKFSIGAAGL
jgi:hypothetical protein